MPEYTCTICEESITSSKRKIVECKNCKEACCLLCFKKYLIESENITPKCMFCSQNIPYSFIREICSINFCNTTLHEKRTKIEMERQKTLLPGTQHLANLEMERRKFFEEIKLYDDRINELKREIFIIQRQKNQVPWPTVHNINREENRITFIQKCPVEGCNGFLNSSWKCGICETYICSKCLVPKQNRVDENHVCDENLVASITSIKKDSKPCPKCATYIFKIEGCDQMWCVECKTAFSWKTGRIENGTLHNPHYFEYMRTVNSGMVPRQPGDIRPCDVVPNFTTIWHALSRWKRKNSNTRELERRVNTFFRNRNHFDRINIPRVNNDYQEEYSRIRIFYLLKDINEEVFKSKVSKILKKEERDTEILEIYNLYHTVTGEVLKNINEMLCNQCEEITIYEELNSTKKIIEFCNSKLTKLSKQFKNKIQLIKE
tara:strand:+ start:83 stop:1381 length:1299 start_codon:yes stop_codon:yes gene_type:complete